MNKKYLQKQDSVQPFTNTDFYKDKFYFLDYKSEHSKLISVLSKEKKKYYFDKGEDEFEIEYYYKNCNKSHVFGRGYIFEIILINGDTNTIEQKANNLLKDLFSDKEDLKIIKIQICERNKK